MSKHILLLGATGPSGIAFAEAALEEGHNLTIYARNPSKLPRDVAEHQSVNIIEGMFEDKEKLKEAAQCGATVFVSFAGPLPSSTGTPITHAYEALFPHLIANNYTRALVLATASFPAPEDKRSWKFIPLVAFIRTFGNAAYREIVGIGTVVSKQPAEKIGWTIFRVPFLRGPRDKSARASEDKEGKGKGKDTNTDTPVDTAASAKHTGAPVTATFLGTGEEGLFLDRGDMARWALAEMVENQWVGKAPVISN